MRGTNDAVSSRLATANPGVQALLSEGMPIDLTAHSTRAYIGRCQALLAGLDDASLEAVQVMTAQVVAQAQIDPVLGLPLAGHLTHTAHDLERHSRANGAGADQRTADLLHAYALVAFGFTHTSPEHTVARIEAGHDILRTATLYGDSVLMPAGYVLLLTGLLEQGEIRSLDTHILDEQLIQLDSPAHRHVSPARWFSCLRLILDGDTEAAEAEARAIYERAERQGTGAFALFITQMGMIRWMQGRIADDEADLLRARREYPEQLLWSASLVWRWLLQGRRAAAEAFMRTFPDIDDLPKDPYWLATMTMLAEIAVLNGSREQAERIRAYLLPYADRLASIGSGVAFWSTVARPLGLLEERLGLVKEAREHLELAVTMSARIGAMAWHAEAQIDLAEFALRNHIAEVPAYTLLAEAQATSEARGFSVLARRAMYRPRIRVLGGFEVVSLCGTKAEWSSKKARELLKMLVAARGIVTSREVFMDSLWPGESPTALGNRFSVAVNVIRRALDPQRLLPTQHHVVTEGEAVRLELAHIDVDLERFLALARGDTVSQEAAKRLYRGDAFSEERYADWAMRVREQAQYVRSTIDEGRLSVQPADGA